MFFFSSHEEDGICRKRGVWSLGRVAGVAVVTCL